MQRRKQKRHNPVAKALRLPQCRQQVVRDRKRAAKAVGYANTKHPTKEHSHAIH